MGKKAKTLQAQHCWALGTAVPGFALAVCYTQRRRASGAWGHFAHLPTLSDAVTGTLQCIDSDRCGDGSVCVDAGASQRVAGRSTVGASHTLSRRVGAHGWPIALGRVPLASLVRFAGNAAQARSRWIQRIFFKGGWLGGGMGNQSPWSLSQWQVPQARSTVGLKGR